MTVVELPRKFGPKPPRHVFRRVSYTRRAPAEVVTFPVRSAELAYNLYLTANVVDETDIEAGIALYERALALDPTLTLALTNLGNCHFRQGRPDLARELYQRALAFDPRQPEALHNLGYITLERGDAAAAVSLIEAAIEEDPCFADAWFNLGMARKRRLGTHLSPAVSVCFRRYLKLTGGGSEWADIARRNIA
jgi:tetratricopeptide (TPR) repeat protein